MNDGTVIRNYRVESMRFIFKESGLKSFGDSTPEAFLQQNFIPQNQIKATLCFLAGVITKSVGVNRLVP